MKDIFFAEVFTEDGEKYRYAFKDKPSNEDVKKIFFYSMGSVYDIADWGICITCNIHILELR